MTHFFPRRPILAYYWGFHTENLISNIILKLIPLKRNPPFSQKGTKYPNSDIYRNSDIFLTSRKCQYYEALQYVI